MDHGNLHEKLFRSLSPHIMTGVLQIVSSPGGENELHNLICNSPPTFFGIQQMDQLMERTSFREMGVAQEIYSIWMASAQLLSPTKKQTQVSLSCSSSFFFIFFFINFLCVIVIGTSKEYMS